MCYKHVVVYGNMLYFSNCFMRSAWRALAEVVRNDNDHETNTNTHANDNDTYSDTNNVYKLL